MNKLLLGNKEFSNITDEEKHEIWLKKFNQTRKGKIFNLMSDLKSNTALIGKKRVEPKSYLAYCISVLSKGTQYEEDCTEIIKMCCPDYYQEEPKPEE